MSAIPTIFDPLGMLGGGMRPYIQPIFAGADTWSNEPSFPMRVQWQTFSGDGFGTPLTPQDTMYQTYFNGTFSAWENMSGDKPPKGGLAPVNSTTSARALVLTFAKPVYLKSLSFTTKNLYASSFSATSTFGLYLGSATTAASTIVVRRTSGSMAAEATFELAEPTLVSSLLLRLIAADGITEGSRQTTVNNLQINALYK